MALYKLNKLYFFIGKYTNTNHHHDHHEQQKHKEKRPEVLTKEWGTGKVFGRRKGGNNTIIIQKIAKAHTGILFYLTA